MNNDEYVTKEEIFNYQNAFVKGYNYVMFGSNKEEREIPSVDYDDLNSIGYKDGIDYGEYLEATYQTNSPSYEQLLANMDKYLNNALKRRDSYLEKYEVYEKGFMDGRCDVLEKCQNNDDSFNVIPALNDNDIYSIGYFDGYCYFLRDVLDKEGIDLVEINDMHEIISPYEICRNSFKTSYVTYNISNIKKESIK